MSDTERRVKASEFKARCLALLDEVAETGESLVITKRGQPVGRLVPYATRPESLFAVDRDRIVMRDDLIEPTGARWDADAEP